MKKGEGKNLKIKIFCSDPVSLYMMIHLNFIGPFFKLIFDFMTHPSPHPSVHM